MDRQEIVRGFHIKGLGITTYCKVKAIGTKVNVSFGKKMKNFCVVFSYNHSYPTELYLDRVESDKDCILGGRLKDLEKGAVRFVKLALYAMKRWFPKVEVIRLNDDSKIDCKGSSVKMVLPLDYIAKYGKTWYEYNFHAVIDNIENNKTIEEYYRNLEVLTQPHTMDYDHTVRKVSFMKPFEAQFRASTTPRDFLQRVRVQLGDQYCENGSALLDAYMAYLGINHVPKWKILMKDVETVPDFERKEMGRTDAKQMLNGGGRSRRVRRIGHKRPTRHRVARYQLVSSMHRMKK